MHTLNHISLLPFPVYLPDYLSLLSPWMLAPSLPSPPVSVLPKFRLNDIRVNHSPGSIEEIRLDMQPLAIDIALLDFL